MTSRRSNRQPDIPVAVPVTTKEATAFPLAKVTHVETHDPSTRMIGGRLVTPEATAVQIRFQEGWFDDIVYFVPTRPSDNPIRYTPSLYGDRSRDLYEWEQLRRSRRGGRDPVTIPQANDAQFL